MTPLIDGISGAGLGLRRPYLKAFRKEPPEAVDFFELAPENWIGVGGALGGQLRFFTERWPVIAHGLSLSIGGPHPLNEPLVRDVGADAIPAERVLYLHTAGHYDEAPDLLIDTHGAAVKDEVWALLEHAYSRLGARPTVLERDFNQPPLPELLAEVARIRDVQQALGTKSQGIAAPSGGKTP